MVKIAAVRWNDSENWQKVVRDVRTSLNERVAKLTRTAPGVDALSVWWVDWGQAVNRTNRARKEIFDALVSFRAQKPAVAVEPWFKSAVLIIKASPALTNTPRTLNTAGTRREAAAKLSSTYLRLLEAAATVRDGIKTGKTRTTLQKLETREARAPATMLRTPFDFRMPSYFKSALIAAAVLYGLSLFAGRKK